MRDSRTKRPDTSSQQRGFTMIEVMIIVVMLLSAGAAMMSSVTVSSAERVIAEQRAALLEEARGMADRIAASPIDEVFARWGPGGTAGPSFTLRSVRNAVGSIRVIVNERMTDAALGTTLGMPRDLDGDGAVASLDVSTTARVLPVLVEVHWTPAVGPAQDFRLPVTVVR